MLVVPWIQLWDRNFFAESFRLVDAVVSNNYVRGAVSGLGLVNVFIGLIDLGRLLAGRERRPRHQVVRLSIPKPPLTPPTVDESPVNRVEVG